jgi:hypothetical protein
LNVAWRTSGIQQHVSCHAIAVHLTQIAVVHADAAWAETDVIFSIFGIHQL